MRIRVILERRSWEYRLQIFQQEPGRYYVELRGLHGEKFKPSPIAGSYPSVDLVIAESETIYLTLVAMREAAVVPTPTQPEPVAQHATVHS